jgi:glycolate oxidase
MCVDAGARDVRVAQNDAERSLIWKTRKAAFAAMGRIAPAYYVQDGVIPRTRLSEVLGRIDALASEYGLQVANVFHAGDGNLHPLVCYDSAREGEAERAEELAGLIVKACVEAGGSITGEHGVGVDKKRYMPEMFAEPDLDAFQRLRCAFDPHGLANPGKVMPTPRLCGEVPGPYREHPLERAGVAERF